MRKIKVINISARVCLFSFTFAALVCCQSVRGQVPGPPNESAKKSSQQPHPPGTVVVENRVPVPQVVTILHRLNGLKMLKLLLRANEGLFVIDQLDEAFEMNGDVHTNVIAGLAIDDGLTIAAWLPELEAELRPSLVTLFPPNPKKPTAPQPPTPQVPLMPMQSMLARTRGLFESPDVTVIARDGKEFQARYVGLDGTTGLSILRLTDLNLERRDVARVVAMGQRLRLIGPEPAAKVASGFGIYVRVGEREGRITNVARAPSGALSRIKMRLARLSPANIGGIAVNDAGETVGIVEAVDGVEASILPMTLIQDAARRVLKRQASVPRPWLGVSGEPIATPSLQHLLSSGWGEPQAISMADSRRGILLTSVAPGSPAASAELRPGDVILRVNDAELHSADDFSWFLKEAGPGGSVRLTIARPDRGKPESIDVVLSGTFDFDIPFGKFFGRANASYGFETIALHPTVASRMGANAGMLVVDVQPSTAASKAGLLPGDIIQAVNGEKLSATGMRLVFKPGMTYTLEIVRNRQKQLLTVEFAVD